jgi:hypothetical protein
MAERRIDGLRPCDGNGTGSINGASAVVSHALAKILADMVEHALTRNAGRTRTGQVESAQGDEESEL